MLINRLRIVREENNMLQKDVAAFLNVSLGTYAMNESGHDTITLKNLILFCDYFNTSVDYIMGLTNIKCYDNTISFFDKTTLATRLKEFRKDNNLTQNKVSVFLNIDHSVWCRYEQGKTVISTSFLYDICKKYKISADYLLGKIDSPKYLK